MSDENINQSDEHLYNATSVLSDIESNLIDFKQKFKSEVSTRRWLFLVAAFFAVVLGLNQYGKITLSLWWIVPSWFFAILFALAGFGTNPNKTLTEIEKLQSIKKIHFSFLDAKDEPYFDKLVKINVENLSEYYLLVKEHTKQSFTLSVAIISIGFILITGGLAIGFVKPEFKDISYVSTASGTLISFIGGSVFWLYSRTVLQLKHYHDSLLDVQNILLAFKLVESADKDSTERSNMTQKMIEFLSSRRSE